MSELRCYSYEESVGLAAPIINSHFDITNLYNSHGTVEHAKQSAGYIEPDSIVFLEGPYISYDPIPDYDLDRAIARLGGMRLQLGREHPAYLRDKQRVLDVLDSILDELPEHNPDFAGHIYGIRRELVAKDCIVMVADANLSTVPEDQRDEEMLGTLERALDHLGYTDFDSTDQISARRRFAKSMLNYGQYVRMQHVRETLSISTVAGKLRKMALADWIKPDLATTELHKRRVYTVWGTNHAASLTGEYMRRGIDVRQKVIDSDNDPRRYIPNHEAGLRPLAYKRVLSQVAADAIYATGLYRGAPVEDYELSDRIAETDRETAVHAYMGFDRLLRTMGLLETEYSIAMQYAAPRPEIFSEFNAETLNVWNELQAIGLTPGDYMSRPFRGAPQPSVDG